MTSYLRRISAILPIAASMCAGSLSMAADEAAVEDPGWPREFSADGRKLTIYQPQVDDWKDHSSMHVRCAVLVEGVLKEGKFGVVEIEAATLVDQASRSVKLFATTREMRFAGVSEADEKLLREAVDLLSPPQRLVSVSLDRVLACLDPATAAQQKAVAVNLNPPKIFHSDKPAVLVVFLGKPDFQPVVANKPELMFAVNTNWDVFFEPASKSYFLLNEDHWLTGTSAEGPWTLASKLPDALKNLPEDDNWADIRKNIPGKSVPAPEQVFASTEPAELILTDGKPAFQPVAGTRLLEVSNSESMVLLDSADGRFYYQAAGRWFRADKLEGPWSAASSNLPEDFAKIPDDHELAFVKATVPGTDEAKDAVLLASVPQATYVDATAAPTLEVSYKGEPDFQPIPTTSVSYAVNSPFAVFRVNNGYFCCDQGVWFSAPAAAGPWAWCTEVPAAIYTIPPTSPAHNVTYVTVKESTPDTVVYTQTAGYSGEYVAANGVLMFGAGLLLGAILNDDDHHHYCYPAPAFYSYGCGASYHYGYGGYYGSGGRVYGPYGGAGYVAAYNPATRIYSRGAYAYGPRGSAGFRQAYNPYTGAYAAAGYRATPRGSAAGGKVYNPYTGTTAAAGRVSNSYGSAARMAAYNPATGKGVKGTAVSGDKGSAGAIRTSQGAGIASWDTDKGKGTVAKTANGNFYAAHDGTVYKKDPNGGWSSNSGNGWQDAGESRPNGQGQQRPDTRPQPVAPQQRPSVQPRSAPSLDSMARSRDRGNVQTQRAQSWQGGAAARGASGGGAKGGLKGRR